MFLKILVRLKKDDYSVKSNYYDSHKLFVGKIKDEMGCNAIEEFVALKLKMYSFLVDDTSEHKKGNNENKNTVAAISHSEYKDVFLNNKCFRHLMNRIQSKNHKIGTYFYVLMIQYIS